LDAAKADLEGRAVRGVLLLRVLGVLGQRTLVECLVAQLHAAFALTANHEVRLLEEVDAVIGQRESRSFAAAGVCERVSLLGGARLPAGTNLVVRSPNIVRDEGVQRSINALGFFVLFGVVLALRCHLLDEALRVRDRGRIHLYLGLVVQVFLGVCTVGVRASVLLETHRVVRSFVFLVSAHFEVCLQSGPGSTVLAAGRLCRSSD
jgi:hypothetical protein